jgi:hypothetical protein
MTNNLNLFTQVTWLDPWEATSAGLEMELEKEISQNHPLFGLKVTSVARRIDKDDVLFYLPDSIPSLAKVHLTWKGSVEINPRLPRTTFYRDVADWIEKGMMKDHLEYFERSQD